MNEKTPFPRLLTRIGSAGLVLAVLGAIGLVAAGLTGGTDQFLHAYLYGWIFWTSLTIGCFGLMLLQTIVRASWGFPVIRLFEAGSKMMPIMGLGCIPLIIAAYTGHLYPWADPAMVRQDPVLHYRAIYFNPFGFMFRNIIYFVFFTFITWLLSYLSREQDRTGNMEIAQNRVNIAAPSFVIMVLLVTFAITDWVMSLDPHWYSTIYGFWFIICSGLTAMALITLIGCRLKMGGYVPFNVTPQHPDSIITRGVTRDWGNLLLTMIMVWAYFSLSQFLITWSGNLPAEITYYIKRNTGLLAWYTAFMVIFQFFVPFLCLLSSRAKRTPGLLAAVAALIVCVRVFEVAWNIIPMFHPLYAGLGPQLEGILFYLASLVGFGGIWLYGFITFAKSTPLIPSSELVAEEVLHHAS